MRLLKYWRLALGPAATLSVSLALAADPTSPYPECSRKPTAADIEGAKGAHKAASQFYDRGDYDKAVRYWTDAYGFDCNAHGVLINIANAYEKKGDKPSAILALKTYQKRANNGNGDPTIEEKIKNLEASMLPPAPSATASGAPSIAPSATASVAPSATPTTPGPEGPRPYGWKPWILVGGGGVVAIVGAILLPVGLGAIAEAKKKCTPAKDREGNEVLDCHGDAEAEAQGNLGRTEVGLGAAFIGVGGAALIGGLVWQFAFNKPEDKRAARVRVLPAVGPRNAGLLLQGSF